MTRRYTSGFDILGFDTDPTPGDPDLILNQVAPFYQAIGDDSQAAVTALKSSAITGGSGQTMAALHKLISTDYPPKLQQAADSFHSAASIYTTYAQSLAEAQNQLDQAMDQATPVATTANTTVQPAPANATAAQTSAAQQQQQNVDQANALLTAAKRLGQDAKDLRDQAGNTFNHNLNEVSSIPGESFFQKLLDVFKDIGNFIKDNIKVILQVIVDVAVAVTSIFFPVVGLLLGAAVFGITTVVNTATTGHFDVGAFVAGLLTLALGAGSASGLFTAGSLLKVGFSALKATPSAVAGAAKAAGTTLGLTKAAGTAAEDAAGVAGDASEAAAGDASEAGSYFGTAPGTAADGVQDSSTSIASSIGKSLGKVAGTPLGKAAVTTVTHFGLDTVPTAVGDALDHQKINAGELLGSAAAGAVVGGAFKGLKAGLGFDSPSEEPASPTAASVGDEPDLDKALPPTSASGTAITQIGSIASETAKVGTTIGIAHRDGDDSESPGERADEGASSVEPTLADGKF
jgi:hypothetical protein